MLESESEQSLAKAKVLFAKARTIAEGGNYDYAIDVYLEGLRFAPDALEEGHVGLCEMALHRASRGGKKPSMVEKVKRLRGKSPLEQLLNAEYLFAKDPKHIPYAEAMLKAAVEGGYKKTATWVANLIFQTNNALRKPSLQTYLTLKDSYAAIGAYDRAAAACQCAMRLKPDNDELMEDYKHLSAEVTVARGKYDQEGDFRESIKDRESQERLQAQDGVVKTKNYRLLAVEEAKRKMGQNPNLVMNIFKLAEALSDMGEDESENEAIELLEDAYEERNDFSFKQRSGKFRMKQLRRKIREAQKEVESNPEDVLASAGVDELTKALREIELEHYRLCVENYPTDLEAKYEYGLCLLKEAIPLFQESQRDPRRRISAMSKVGECFFRKGWFADAIDVFSRAIDSYEIKEDGMAKELRYNLARAYEENNEKDKALELYRRIAQLDFGFRDVRHRVDALRNKDGEPTSQ
jgi:hypothetical protein